MRNFRASSGRPDPLRTSYYVPYVLSQPDPLRAYD